MQSGGVSGVGGSGTGGQVGSGGTVNTGGNDAGASGGTETTGGTGGDLATGGGTTGGGDGAGGAGTGGEDGTGGAASFSPCPSEGACAILPLGDSITEGFGSSGGGYRVELFRQAVRAGKSITFVGTLQNGPTGNIEGQPFPRRHQGHGGFTIDSGPGHNGISGSITNNALDMFHPNIVLLMIGTNDINGNIDVQNAPTRLGNFIDAITSRAPESLVVVATIVPVIQGGTNQRVIAYNQGVKAAVETRAEAGKHVILLDNYDAIFTRANWQSQLMVDNLHPNDPGYAVLGQSFFAAIEEYLP